MSDGEEDYFLPLQDQRVFGAGIKRKGIAFVAASNEDTAGAVPRRNTTTNSSSVGDRYLSIVLPTTAPTAITQPTSPIPSPVLENSTPPQLCTICHQPMTTNNNSTSGTHESSIAHQLCLTHSHPPSHLPRAHVGLKYLSNYGWDPDSRSGLGSRGDGIRAPIKAREKNDTAGLRERVDDDDDEATSMMVQQRRKRRDRIEKDERGTVVARLNAKEVRRKESEAKKRAEKLRASFYGQDLEAYLGPGG